MMKLLLLLLPFFLLACNQAEPDPRDDPTPPTVPAQVGTTRPPTCTREWNAAKADSVWNCPDPHPPAPPKGALK